MIGFATLARRQRWLSYCSLPVLGVLGLTGSLLIVWSSAWVAATPTYFRPRGLPGLSLLPLGDGWGRLLYYVGLALVVGAWMLLGRRLISEPRLDPWRAIRRLGALWSVPMVLAMPLGSRDLWAYAAQADVIDHSLNPYRYGPRAVADAFTAQVSPMWRNTPSPYGPLWLWINRFVAELCGGHVLITVEILRVISALGLLMLMWTLPLLAHRLGGHRSLTLWAVVANPVFVLYGVGGGHNDLLMIGLMSVGFVAATGVLPLVPAMTSGGALIGLAAAIKLPAAVAVLFLVLVWLRQQPEHGSTSWTRRREVLTGLLAAGGACVVSYAAIDAASGFGLGWIAQADGPGHGGGTVRTILMIIVVLVIWSTALRWDPMTMAAVALLAVVLITPIAPPWFWCWPIAVGAPLLRGRSATAALGAVSVALVLWVRPDGQSAHLRLELLLAIGALVAWLLIGRTWSPRQMSSNPFSLRPAEQTLSPSMKDRTDPSADPG